MQETETLARADTGWGEVALRRRGDVVELIVNGAFAMDSVETASEIALADAALDAAPSGRVLVGGLGLGYTAARLLDGGASEIDIVELAEPLVDWAKAGITPQLQRVADDPRVRLHVADIADWIGTHDRTWDAICLDVDNGPSFLIHERNARLYRRDLLDIFHARLAPGGVLLIWCEERSPGLHATMRELDAAASEILMPIEREGRRFEYALYRCQRRD